MREIKFRAWAVEEEKMYYSPLMQEWDGFDAWLRLDCENNDISEGSVKLMQYTGLKDKNGKEIYEGDVLRFETGCLGVVIYEPPSWGVDWGGVTNFGGIFYNKAEIIGNIHENPELLKEVSDKIKVKA